MSPLAQRMRIMRLLRGRHKVFTLSLLILLVEFFITRWYVMPGPSAGNWEQKAIKAMERTLFQMSREERILTMLPYRVDKIDTVLNEVIDILIKKNHPYFATWPEGENETVLRTKNSDVVCEYYNKIGAAKRLVLKNIFHIKRPDKAEVTVVSQTSLNRLDRLVRLGDSWTGPISIAVHVQRDEIHQLGYELISLVRNVSKLMYISLHLVIDLAQTEHYPINYLRNVALNASTTQRIFLLDIDFIPSPGLYKMLRNCDMTFHDAMVVAPFEVHDWNMTTVEIKDTENLFYAWELGMVSPFWSRWFLASHRATDHVRWKTATKKYRIKYELLFEPYVLVKKSSSLPHFDELYMDRWFNKVSFFYTLYMAGFDFYVMPKEFILHYGHQYENRRFDPYNNCSQALWSRTRWGTRKLFKTYQERDQQIEESENQQKSKKLSNVMRFATNV